MGVPGLLKICTKRVGSLLALLCALPAVSVAERLPVTVYTTGNGLAHNWVYKVVPDSRGFIWFATREGLSRFDGYTFTNDGVDDGLPSANVHDLLETREGVYLVATTAGLARLEITHRKTGGAADPSGALFSVHQISSEPAARYVLALNQDRSGQVWVGTRAGLFALENAAGQMTFRPVGLESRPSDPPPRVFGVREDRFGSLWVATGSGVRRLWPDGRMETHAAKYGVLSVLEDRAGNIWLGTQLDGLVELTLDATSGTGAGDKTVVGTTVPGLGDDAFFVMAGLMPMLHVRKGDAAIVVEAQGASDVQLVAIARKALERLRQ